MSAFGTGEAYDDNPFVFFASDEYVINPQQKQEMPNPLRAMYEDLAPLLLRSPPSKRYPQQPTGMKEWDILSDPISELVFTSAIPDPVLGGTLQRTMRPTIEGKEGLATHLNILVDCSGSMGEGTYYGVSPSGFPLAGYHLAQICTAMMIAQAGLAKDSFAVWGFSSSGYKIWDGPSQEHKRAIDFFLDLVPQNDAPFRPNNATTMRAGINQVGQDLKGYDFDQSVTVIIMDGGNCGSASGAERELFSKDLTYNDEDLRKMGPVFYVVLGSPFNESIMENFANNIRNTLSKHYKQNMEGCCLSFFIEVGDDGSMVGMAGDLVQMAQVNAGMNTTLKPCPKI